MLVNHHVKYKEIHGEDIVVLMERSEHKKLHARLRRESKCNIPSSELHRISSLVIGRRKYQDKTVQNLEFTETLCKNIQLIERIKYNRNTGCVSTWSGFIMNNGANK